MDLSQTNDWLRSSAKKRAGLKVDHGECFERELKKLLHRRTSANKSINQPSLEQANYLQKKNFLNRGWEKEFRDILAMLKL